MDDPNAIQIVGPNDFITCPHCRNRTEVLFTVKDGTTQPKLAAPVEETGFPIFIARCAEHGDFYFHIDTVLPRKEPHD
ncbi:hypothetical protein [Croceicoccus naphthovorans]|uniref:Uncharacterized protein n=2 Tax=Croceicoccus naphthovorans TaxID=1348774 RepID=A0A0G3XDT9_9SPHN|nr:hypothetical protein [Croceicoccus naphthovorans]AKM09367.1 hypothetical protein AB433_04205 [Croceicoccus naphthovorans]